MRLFIHRAGSHHHDASVLGTAVLLRRGGQLVHAVNGRDDISAFGAEIEPGSRARLRETFALMD